MISKITEFVIHLPVFQLVVGLATIFGFISIIIQIRKNSAGERASRTIDLIGRYYKDYNELEISVKPQDIFDLDERERVGKNYLKQLNFLYELAMYWQRGLLDKEIIKSELQGKIALDTFALEQSYKDSKNYSTRLKALIEMRDEIVAKDPMNHKLVKFWKRLGFKKYYYPSIHEKL